jgi:hypothetical protein
MVPLARILLTAACALVVLTAATPARAGEFAQKQASVGSEPSVTQCGMLKRAISRRACLARLEIVAPINTEIAARSHDGRPPSRPWQTWMAGTSPAMTKYERR